MDSDVYSRPGRQTITNINRVLGDIDSKAPASASNFDELDSLIEEVGQAIPGVNDVPMQVKGDLDSILNEVLPARTPLSSGPAAPSVVSVAPAMPAGAGATAPRGPVLTGPPAGGRGVVMTGPPSGGRGVVMTGPPGRGGVMTGPPPASGRGAVMTGPPARGPVGAPTPVNAGRGGAGIGGMATHTPDGREIKVTGPPCAHCGEMIIGRVTNALGKTYHPEHFVCAHCARPFPDGKFIEQEGLPYCENDYVALFATRCCRCNQPITGKIVNACNKAFHPDHFMCTECATPLAGKAYKSDGGEPYCTQCFQARQIKIDPKVHICSMCKQPILGEYIMYNNQPMHPEHFLCEMCGAKFEGGDCHEKNGKLYCTECYKKLLRDVCYGCRKPIQGRSVTAMMRVWHPECFCCTYCHEPVTDLTFYAHEDKPYCITHYKQLFAPPCAKCNKPVSENGVTLCGKIWHKEHFCCTACEELLKPGEICEMEGKPMCTKCFARLPEKVRKAVLERQKAERAAQKRREKEEKKEEKRREKEAKKRAKEASSREEIAQ